MTIRVGTSGFSYVEWKGTFYPEKLPQKKMLAYYAERFSTVEINATFYRMPKSDMLAGWLPEVPAGFSFVLKAPQRITHHKRLVEAEDDTRHFVSVARVMGEKLGPLLFQLPPHLKKDLPRLAAFLDVFEPGTKLVLEAGDPSWFSDDVYELLRARGVALCIVDDASPRKAAPFVRTAEHGYLRLRRVSYTDDEIAEWARRISDAGFVDAWVFFKHEDAGTGPVLAQKLLEALERSR
ncbi:MAG: DUF72 domain-containing protein [Myxococcales bacterium]|nr:DUF72 domain-containing protein [Myxococcales bacterium]